MQNAVHYIVNNKKYVFVDSEFRMVSMIVLRVPFSQNKNFFCFFCYQQTKLVIKNIYFFCFGYRTSGFCFIFFIKQFILGYFIMFSRRACTPRVIEKLNRISHITRGSFIQYIWFADLQFTYSNCTSNRTRSTDNKQAGICTVQYRFFPETTAQ